MCVGGYRDQDHIGPAHPGGDVGGHILQLREPDGSSGFCGTMLLNLLRFQEEFDVGAEAGEITEPDAETPEREVRRHCLRAAATTYHSDDRVPPSRTLLCCCAHHTDAPFDHALRIDMPR